MKNSIRKVNEEMDEEMDKKWMKNSIRKVNEKMDEEVDKWIKSG